MLAFISSISAIIVSPFIYDKIKDFQQTDAELIITKKNTELWEILSLSLHNATKLINIQKYMIITQNNQPIFLPTNKYYNIDINNKQLPVKAITDNTYSIIAFKILANTEHLHTIQQLIPSFQYKLPKKHRTCHM